jgi:hypothetical protein
MSVPDLELPAARVRLSGAAVLDNLTVRPLAEQATEMVPTPQRGDLIASEEFSTDSSADDLADWNWIRKDEASATVRDGQLLWPVQNGDLSNASDRGALLLHKQLPDPGSDWMVETKLDLDLGNGELRNYQQAGLVAYRNDSDFARLDKVAIGVTRDVEFGRMVVGSGDGRTAWGGSIEGTPARGTTWLRLAHHTDAAGEHQFRAGFSTDGKNWTWGGVWTFSDGDVPRIGLVTQGGASPKTVAAFDYVRFYRSSWPSQ